MGTDEENVLHFEAGNSKIWFFKTINLTVKLLIRINKSSYDHISYHQASLCTFILLDGIIVQRNQ